MCLPNCLALFLLFISGNSNLRNLLDASIADITGNLAALWPLQHPARNVCNWLVPHPLHACFTSKHCRPRLGSLRVWKGGGVVQNRLRWGFCEYSDCSYHTVHSRGIMYYLVWSNILVTAILKCLWPRLQKANFEDSILILTNATEVWIVRNLFECRKYLHLNDLW